MIKFRTQANLELLRISLVFLFFGILACFWPKLNAIWPIISASIGVVCSLLYFLALSPCVKGSPMKIIAILSFVLAFVTVVVSLLSIILYTCNWLIWQRNHLNDDFKTRAGYRDRFNEKTTVVEKMEWLISPSVNIADLFAIGLNLCMFIFNAAQFSAAAFAAIGGIIDAVWSGVVSGRADETHPLRHA